MTPHRDLKSIIRDRQRKTGESYTIARTQVMRERATLLGAGPTAENGRDGGDGGVQDPVRQEAGVLKVNRQSARLRILGEADEMTFRSSGVWQVAPGHSVTLLSDQRWTWRGDAYASGRIENPRLEIEKLGLVPLPLEGGEADGLRDGREPYWAPDPYAPL